MAPNLKILIAVKYYSIGLPEVALGTGNEKVDLHFQLDSSASYFHIRKQT